ncbi:MAG: ABC transporter substrate-binding protein [Actinomycetota bacterium]
MKRTAAVIGMVLFLSACTGTGGHRRGSPTGNDGPAPIKGGTLHYAVSDDSGLLDPQITLQPSGFALIRATQRGLTAFPPAVSGPGHPDPTTPVGDLSDAPSISTDGTLYTFTLHAGVAFGPPANRALRSQDVRAGIERMFRVRSPIRTYFRMIVGAPEFESGKAPTISGIETPDERTVRIKLLHPANDLLWALAHPAASAVPEGTPAAVRPEALAASGPYRVESAIGGKSIRLVRNPAWVASSDTVRHAYVDDIDVTVGPSTNADLVDEELSPPDGAQLARVESGCLLYVFLAQKDPRLSSGRVRAGIAAALDRTAVLNALHTAHGPFGTPSASVLPPGSLGATDRPVPAQNVAAAKALIAKPFQIPFGRETSGSDAAADGAAAAEIGKELGAAGVSATPAGAPRLSSIYERFAGAELPIGLARWCPDWPGKTGRTTIAAIASPAGQADYGRTEDPVLEAAISAAWSAGAPDAAAAAWKKAEDRLLAIRTIIPIGFLSEDVAVGRRVHGFASHPLFTRGDPTALWLTADGPHGGRVD